MKKSILTFVCVFLVSMTILRAQNPVIRIDTIIAIPGDSVTIPVYFSDFDHVGAITLYIQYNPYILHWGKAANWLSDFNNGFNFANSYNGMIAISCLNYNGVTQSTGKLLDLKMKYLSGSSNLVFTMDCEITDHNGLSLSPPPFFQSGVIAKPLSLSITAKDNIICVGDTCELRVIPTGLFGNYSYHWSSNPLSSSNNAANPEFIVPQTTRFYVTVTSGSLSDTASILIETVDLPPPAQVLPIYPAPNAINQVLPLSFSWQPAADAQEYNMYIWKDVSQSTHMHVAGGPGLLSYQYTDELAPGSTYLWQVNSENICHVTQGVVSQFSMQPLPDLHVSSLETSQPASGQSMQVNWTVINQGDGPTTTPTWYDKVWISVDLDLGSNRSKDVLLGQYPNVSALNPGESYTQTKSVVLPENIYGNYFVFVVTDALDAYDIQFNGPEPVPYNPPPYLYASSNDYGVVKEPHDVPLKKKHDNFNYEAIYLTVPPVPDLIVTNSITPLNTFSGQSISFTYTVQNQGAAVAAQPTWTDKIFISLDTVFNVLDAWPLQSVIHTGFLNQDSSYTVNASALIPVDFTGTYYLYFNIDANNSVFEYVYDGNNIHRSDSIVVYLTPPADLAVSDIVIPQVASMGENIDVQYTVVNQGGSATLVSHWFDKFFFSTSPDYDLSQAIPSLQMQHKNICPAGESYTQTKKVSIPRNISGDWYLYVWTDVAEDVFEYIYEGNNLQRSALPIHVVNPDLVIEPFLIPSADSADVPFTMSFTTKNLGPGFVKYVEWADVVYISPEAEYNPLNVQKVIGVNQDTNLLLNYFISNVEEVEFPNCNAGYYYFYVVADLGNDVYETGHEDNNITRSSSSVEIKRADIKVENLEFLSGAQSGQPLLLKTTLRNIGNGRIVNKTITNRITISISPQPGMADVRELRLSNRLCNLAPNDSMTITDTVILPQDISGPYFLSFFADYAKVVKEGDAEANNLLTAEEPILVTAGPVADLQCVENSFPDTVSAGIPFTSQFVVQNSGTMSVFGGIWEDKLYISTIPAWEPDLAAAFCQWTHEAPLAKDSSYQQSGYCTIPLEYAAGQYYFFLKTDVSDVVYEGGGEENNLLGPFPVFVQAYPVDLAVTKATTVNDTLGVGAKIEVEYQVNNLTLQPMSGSWSDGVFLSEDSILNQQEDIKLAEWAVTSYITPWGSYLLKKSMKLPAGYTGDFYLILCYDIYNSKPDTNRANNVRLVNAPGMSGHSFSVQILPAPDFHVDEFTTPAQVFKGQQYPVSWTVSNEGDTIPNQGWQDKIYLSSDLVINQGDIPVFSKSQSPLLPAGTSYHDSARLQANPMIMGNYYLLLQTDAGDVFYEHQEESDNMAHGLILFSEPPMSDLLPGEVITEPQGQAGEMVTVSWEIRNDGANPLFGPLKDAIYLSADSSLDQGDILWFVYQGDIIITPDSLVSRDTLVPIPGLLPGEYFLLVKTDITNVFNENQETNNVSSGSMLHITFPELYIDSIYSYDMPNLDSRLFMMEVPDSLAGESLVLNLKGDSLYGFNEIYAGINVIPDRIHFDYRYAYELTGNQDLFIPELSAGTYYFMVTGSSSLYPHQTIILQASILQFEIRRVESDKGGVLGKVTVEISGSKFEPDMDIVLVGDSMEIPASRIDFMNSTRVFAQFQLFTEGYGDLDYDVLPVPLGYYTVKAINKKLETCQLVDGFEIVPFQQPELLVDVGYPPWVRSMNVFIMNVTCINIGNTDIPVPKRILKSDNEAPLGWTSKSLQYEMMYLDMEFVEEGGPTNVLRPGAVCTLKVYCRARYVDSMHQGEETRMQVFRLLEE